MAQPTVVSRPATWAGTSNPIVYKFTSTNYSNAGYSMQVEIWDATAAAKIADAKYYANSSGALIVDVSAFLRSNLSTDNEADLTTGTIYEDVNWIKYYIKYQEVWTASSETQVNDSANPRWAIYGGVQLGSINDFTDYIDGSGFLFPINQSEGTAIINYPFLCSFIIDGSTDYTLNVKRYLNSVFVDSTDYNDFILNGGCLIFRMNETTLNADRYDLSLSKTVNQLPALTEFTDVGSGDSWTLGATPSVTLTTTGDFSSLLYIETPLILESGQSYTFDYEINFGSNPNGQMNFNTMNGLVIVDNGVFYVDDTGLQTGSIVITPSGDSDGIGLRARNLNASPNTITVISFQLQSTTVVSETKTINILEDCKNIVMLQWRNSQGGMECYPFTYTQEYTWDYSGGKKAKRLTLFANNLTLNQWEAIQGLNTLGELYRTNITEMTTSLNRTSATIGQSVYVLNADGTKTGVNVIGQPNSTMTKQQTHSAYVTIEYPELFLQ